MSSQLDLHLHTNYCPSDEEIGQIRSYLAAERARLLDIEDSLRKLQSTRDELAERIAAYDALVSPARRIPADLLQEIFVAGLPTYRNCTMSSMEGPLLYGRICSGWRAIVLQSPRLWASLHVVEPSQWKSGSRIPSSIYERKVELRHNAIQLWLARSGQLPLSISYHQSATMSFLGERPSVLPRLDLLGILIGYARRWKSFELSLSTRDHPQSLSELGALGPEDVPLLQHFFLDIQERHWDDMEVLEFPDLGLFHAAELTSLSLSAPRYSLFRTLLADTEWEKITALTINTLPPHEGDSNVLQVISACPALVTLHLTLEMNWDFNDPHAQPMDLQRVECPELRDLDLWGRHDVVAALTCPKLRRLTLGPGRERSESAQTARRPALQGILSTAPLLETLRLLGEVSKDPLLELVQSLPSSLQQLEISDNHATELDAELISSLEYQSMEELILCGCDIDLLPIDSLLGFLSRKTSGNGSASFRKLAVQYTFPFDVDAHALREKFQPFINAGVAISIKHGPASEVFSVFQGAKLSFGDHRLFRKDALTHDAWKDDVVLV
ncbi:hypothetical protein MKEN_00939900 [Mycena kentingensis (nom. inval.)]|nr:hypothetical protein MKEN_00939900 [Mycena kentingensis (nom. inval.)]